MGHTRLGWIPKTKKWDQVVRLLVESEAPLREDVAQIAAATLDAAICALEKAIHDPGLCYSFYLLTQITSASRESDWHAHLSGLGIDLADSPTLFDLTAQAQAATDRYITSRGHATDISEMAQQAAGEALITLASPSLPLFDASGELRATVHQFSTAKGFSRLGQVFFGRFVARFLNFYLSRVTAKEVGGDRLKNVEDITRFNEALVVHSEESARIVRDFCGQWYSKQRYLQGINLDNATRLVAVALGKLRDELGQQRLQL